MHKELKELNPQQKKAVEHKDGPMLVLAGAGAGKTRVITTRIFSLIRAGITPEKILALTFTNKAAGEMKERVLRAIKSEGSLTDDVGSPFIGTFHSLGVKILRESFREAGVPKTFTIYDRNDSKRAMKQAIKHAGFDTKEFSARKMLGYISGRKGDMVTQKEFAHLAGNEYFPRVASTVWEEYEKILKKEGALDFGDLLLRPAKLLKEKKDLLKNYQNRWDYIHIDEYQDTNKVQYELSKMLAWRHKNIFVVGDIDQNIYSWRGANIENIFNFEKEFDNPPTVLLEENYRSTQNILHVANEIIKKNEKRKEKNLFTKNKEGDKLGFFGAYNEKEESQFVAAKSQELINTGVPPKEIAVLYRANFQSRVLEESFLEREIPYQVLGTRFFERKEIKDVLSYVRAALNPDSLADIKRAVKNPRRGIGKVTLAKIFGGKRAQLSPAMKKRVDSFYSLLEEIAMRIKEEEPIKVLKFIIKESGLEEELRKGDEEEIERLENIKELVTLAAKYSVLEPEEGMLKLLEEAALQSEQDNLAKKKEDQNSVRLMTVHAAKGLEFDYVFITGLEEGLFPHESLGDDANRDNEEERRLFYVALTRARKKLFLSMASTRRIYGSKQVNLPSEFLSDIDDELLEEEFFEEQEETIQLD